MNSSLSNSRAVLADTGSKASATADLYLHKTEKQRRDAIRRQNERIAAAASQDSQLVRIGSESGQRQAV